MGALVLPIITAGRYDKQAGEFYRSLSRTDRKHLIEAFSGDLGKVKSHEIRSIITAFLYKADEDYGKAVAKKLM